MARPKGTKKYTEEWVLEFMEEMWKKFSTGSYLFKGQYLTEKEITHTRYSEWKKEYPDNPRIQELYELIDNKQETLILFYGLTKKTSEKLTQFMLINHFNWTDKSVVKHDVDEMPVLVIGKSDAKQSN